MPFILTIVAIASAVILFVIRARNAANAAGELVDMVDDLRLAARRFGFRRRQSQHPMEDVETPDIAIATVANAFFELDTLPTEDSRDILSEEIASAFNLDRQKSTELLALGRWLMTECNTPAMAVHRAAKQLYRIDGVNSVEVLMTVLKNTQSRIGGDMTDRQREALNDITTALKL